MFRYRPHLHSTSSSFFDSDSSWGTSTPLSLLAPLLTHCAFKASHFGIQRVDLPLLELYSHTTTTGFTISYSKAIITRNSRPAYAFAINHLCHTSFATLFPRISFTSGAFPQPRSSTNNGFLGTRKTNHLLRVRLESLAAPNGSPMPDLGIPWYCSLERL